MGIRVKTITTDRFKKKFALKELDPFTTGYFAQKDLDKIREDFGIISIGKKLTTLPDILSIIIKEPLRIILHLPNILATHIKGLSQYYKIKNQPVKEIYPFCDYAIKASVIGLFKPKKLLEIGTARGWGILAFKSVLPKTECFTMSPKNTFGANNELPTKEIGRAFKKKKIDIRQIWSDSLTFDYQSIKPVDVSYIDGNHKYEYVYSDLINCNKITRKAIIVDDYIPTANSPRGSVLKWGWWNEDVVRAVHAFLKKYPKAVKEAYWLENTPVCVLIKQTP